MSREDGKDIINSSGNIDSQRLLDHKRSANQVSDTNGKEQDSDQSDDSSGEERKHSKQSINKLRDTGSSQDSDEDHSKKHKKSNNSHGGHGGGVRHTFADFRDSPTILKTKAVIYIMLSIIGVAYAILTFVTSVNAYLSIGKNPLALSGIIDNWRGTPIVDIKTTDDLSCPSGYSPMYSRYWPGTKAGCKCGDVIKVDDGGCGSGCVSIKSQDREDIAKFYGKKICIKRSGTNIMKAVRPRIDNPSVWDEKDYKPCGKGDQNHEIWVLSSSDCPIDNIKITQDKSLIDYQSQPLANGYFIHFTTQNRDLPLVEFTLTEGSVCIFPNEFDVPSDKPIYPLLRTWKYKGWEDTIGEIKEDKLRWRTIASQTEQDLFKSNPKVYEKVESLDGYSITQSAYTLYSMPYIDWSIQWQHSDMAPMNKIAEDNNPINTLANVQLFYVIISFLSLLIIGLISPGFIVYKQSMVLFGRKEADNDIIASNGMRLIAFFFIVLKGSFLISSMVIIKNFSNMVDYIESHNCTDDTTMKIFLFLKSVLTDAYNQNFFGAITVGIMAICEILSVVTLCMLSIYVKRQDKTANFYINKKK